MSEDFGNEDGISSSLSLNDQLTRIKLENEKLQSDNNSLRNDKSILEEIIGEKDKLINNLQLQIDNLQKFSASLRSPGLYSSPGELPQRSAQRQYRSVSSPVKTYTEDSDQSHEGNYFNSDGAAEIGNEEGLKLEDPPDLSKREISNSFNNDETITEDTEPVSGTPEIPERNPNHHIPPISVETDSPAKSVASSNYSPQKTDDDNDDNTQAARVPDSLNLLATPSASPTRPTANSQRTQYMGLPVSGSSPARVKSPFRGKNPPLSPLKNQIFAESFSSLLSPDLDNVNADEFVFSPSNGSSTNIVKIEDPRSPTLSFSSSIQQSLDSAEPSSQRFTQNGNGAAINGNELESVVKYMDKKLNLKDHKTRSRASTDSVVSHQQQKSTQNTTTSKLSERNVSLNIASLKPPSESNLHKVRSLEFTNAVSESNPFNTNTSLDFNEGVNSPGAQSIISSIGNKKVSTPTTPATVKSAIFTNTNTNNNNANTNTNLEEDELKNLMVRPNDLETTLISVVSVIDGSQPSGKKNSENPSMTFGCFLVESSGERREIFKFSKTYSQLLEFDHIVRAHFFELLPLPELSSFLKTTPHTIEFRRQILNNYFYKLYELKIKPKDLALAICKFVSSDPVFKFDFNEHIVKEGLMLRKASGKLNSSWKITLCSIYGSTLELVDVATNKKQIVNIPECKLMNEEDTKDIRHGISITEPRKNVLSSSFNKIILCAECSNDKAEWLEVLAKASSNSHHHQQQQHKKSSVENMLSVPSGSDVSPDSNSIRYNNPHSPQVYDTPSTPMSQSSHFDDMATLNSMSKTGRKRGGLFSKKRDKPGKTASPEKSFDGTITPSTVIEPVTNLESYQQQQQQYQQQQYVLPSATDSTFTFSPYSPSVNDDFSTGPELFGASLETAIGLSSTEYKGKIIPSICFRCIDYLEQKNAIYSEGIFRLTGKSSEINLLNELFNYKYDVDFNELERLPDVDSISTLLKRYLRSLKESVITPELVSVLKLLPNNESKTLFYKNNVSTILPKINFDLLYILLQYLIKVIKNKEINKMDINNITMLFSVNFNVDEDILSESIINFDYIFDLADKPIPNEQRPYLRR